MSTDFPANALEASPSEATLEQRKKAARRAHRLTTVAILLVFAVTVVGGPALALLIQRRVHAYPDIVPNTTRITSTDPDATTPGNENQPAPVATGPSTDLQTVEDTLTAIRRETDLAKAALALTRCDVVSKSYNALLEATLDDDVGRRIANDDELFERFLVLRKIAELEGKPPDRDDLESLRDGLRTSTDSQFRQDVDQLRIRANDSYAFWQSHTQSLESIRKDASSKPASETTLKEAWEKRGDRPVEGSAKATESANDRRMELQPRLREIETSLQNERKHVGELNDQLTRIQKGILDYDTSESNATTALGSRSDYQRELPLIHKLLTPFITPGYVQPQSADELAYGRSKVPMSYSALERIGALKKETGIQILLRVGGSKSATQNNDRPLGNFPRMNSQAGPKKLDDVAKIKEAQRLLREYGPLMVEDDLLSP